MPAWYLFTFLTGNDRLRLRSHFRISLGNPALMVSLVTSGRCAAARLRGDGWPRLRSLAGAVQSRIHATEVRAASHTKNTYQPIIAANGASCALSCIFVVSCVHQIKLLCWLLRQWYEACQQYCRCAGLEALARTAKDNASKRSVTQLVSLTIGFSKHLLGSCICRAPQLPLTAPKQRSCCLRVC
jgi:hypothetical protein